MRPSVAFPLLLALAMPLALASRPLALASENTPAVGPDGGGATLVLLPAHITLPHVQARQHVVAQWRAGDQYLGQAVNVELVSADPAVVKIERGVAIPAANGTTKLVAKAIGPAGDTHTAEAVVVVSGQDQPFTWSFRNHVESVLSKAGCNGGACHGARAGKNGFKLSLFGYDVEADHTYLTRYAQGRRVNLADPGRSMLLTKPTGVLPHKGGVRLEPDSPEYAVLVDWIASGAPAARADDRRMARLELLPGHSRQTTGAAQQLVALAHFDDGHVEDVTPWVKYTSNNLSVASVDGRGKLTITGAGEAAIVAWYLNVTEIAYVSVPHGREIPPAAFAQAPRHNFIDEHVLAKLRSLNIPPSSPAEDGVFLRRVFLDAIGVLPTVDETRAFLADTRPDKRERLIEALLARPEYVDYWANKWSDLLLVSGERLRPKAVAAYYGFIRENVANNTPWDEFARRVVTASGDTLQNGAANFYALHQDPTDMAETTAQAFLGLSINCAKCHNHPLEKWTNDQYYGFANMFSRVRAKGWGGDFRSGEGDRTVFVEPVGELLQPGKGGPQPPRPLDGPTLAFDDPIDRRVPLAAWLTAPENPYFAKAIVNRVWANFFGVGLVDKVDDLRATNPPSNRPLMDALVEYLVRHDYDVKRLARLIMLSAAYQRSSAVLSENQADDRFYSRYYPRRLKAETLLDALSQVTGASSEFKDLPPGTRALALPDAATPSYFLTTFGRPQRLITCDCERADEPSMTQVLHMLNGDTLNNKLRLADNAIGRHAASGAPSAAILEELFLAALCRQPTEQESRRFAELLEQHKSSDPRALLEDVYWSVLTTREFLFNH